MSSFKNKLFTQSEKMQLYVYLYGRYALGYESFLTIFSLWTQQIDVQLVALISKFYLTSTVTPFIFREHSL